MALQVELPDHITKSLIAHVGCNKVGAASAEKLDTRECWAHRLHCVEMVHTVPSEAKLSKGSHSIDFNPFESQSSCSDKDHQHTILLLGIRKKSVQSARQAHLFAWNVCQRAPESKCLISREVGRDRQSGIVCSLIDSAQDKPQWVYLATVDQVDPDNLRKLARSVADIKNPVANAALRNIGHNTQEEYEREVKRRAVSISIDYSTGLYPDPKTAKLISDVRTLVSNNLTSSVCVLFDVYFLVI